MFGNEEDGDEYSDIMIERPRRPHDDVEGLDHKSITTSPWSTRDVKKKLLLPWSTSDVKLLPHWNTSDVNYFPIGTQVT